MKPVIRLILVALVAGVVAFGITKQLTPDATTTSEVAWLESEFALTPEQAAKITALHDAYRPVCAAHCEAIMTTREALAAATAPSERAATESQLQSLIATCHANTREHLRAVAAAMSSDQGQRYLDMIGPRLTAHQHAQPFGLR
ncbi:Spy/CpxP family protein refolding chaperone [Synoicihabitans lomoniglobus]|uniref:Spy/CpxP family protein refolding chaperone n=1 Tax=Synoicihabitans lomoniglobus TaxID=2909285 RepID=A0AAE9ZV53_9BACT|nr:Spy/CpxP family protein refolding chaperone [Opitutaceae bacterium LMO-M01]WED63644.1 Spy/CpxP family protein refolding chaperone [Opitutaceae bacterium LMO-M01]